MADDQKIDAYIDTISKLEPDIAPIDIGAAAASIAISLKRIADALDGTSAGVNISESLCGGRPDQFRVG